MGKDITLTASDGFELHGYRADPEGTPKGGIVVIMEIFGVNEHIRDLCDRFAEVGYLAVAPALYDRFEKGFEVGYTPDDIAKGRVMKDKGNENFDNVLLDVEAARKVAADVQTGDLDAERAEGIHFNGHGLLCLSWMIPIDGAGGSPPRLFCLGRPAHGAGGRRI